MGLNRARALNARIHSTPRSSKTPQTSTRRNSTEMSPIEAAIEAIESLKPEEQLSYTKVASQFSADRSMLSQRHKAIQVLRSTAVLTRRKLGAQ
jgi:hypothetical protein